MKEYLKVFAKNFFGCLAVVIVCLFGIAIFVGIMMALAAVATWNPIAGVVLLILLLVTIAALMETSRQFNKDKYICCTDNSCGRNHY